MGESRASSSGKFYGVPLFVRHLRVDAPRKSFHAQNEEVGGHGIPLPDASGGLEELCFCPID